MALYYRLLCDRQWRSREALIGGWAGERDIEISIERTTAGAWRINGREIAALIGIEEIDLGFTPGSNTNAIRRLKLRTGQGAESVAAWLDPGDWRVRPLRQSYRRIGQFSYEYESYLHGYRVTLTVDDFGAIREYPALWTAIAGT